MQPWLADSGANAHVTPDLGQLTNYRDYHGGEHVNGVLGGTSLEIAKVGFSFVCTYLILFFCPHMPLLIFSLLKLVLC